MRRGSLIGLPLSFYADRWRLVLSSGPAEARSPNDQDHCGCSYHKDDYKSETSYTPSEHYRNIAKGRC
jgi:hypothetical protein